MLYLPGKAKGIAVVNMIWVLSAVLPGLIGKLGFISPHGGEFLNLDWVKGFPPEKTGRLQ